MEEVIKENCGVVVAPTLHDAYSLLASLQHRGREAAGIAAVSDERIDVLKWTGSVNSFDLKDLHKIFPGHNYHTFLGHVRYATRGRKDQILDDAHPHVIGGTTHHKGNHTITLDCDAAIVHNGQIDSKYLTDVDSSLLNTGCDSEAFLHYILLKGERETLKNIPASYVAAIADKKRKGILVLRDKGGVKPGSLFWKDDRYGIVSEDVACLKNGGEIIEELSPGGFYYLQNNSKKPNVDQVVPPDPHYCFFEWNYISHVNSAINGLRVKRIREDLGRVIAREFQEKIDFISYAPRCPEVAARTCAREKNMEDKFIHLFYKMRGERSFQGSDSKDRENSITKNLFLIPGVEEKVRDSVILIIDDSSVRGNVSKRVNELILEAGIKKAYFMNYTPPIGIIDSKGVLRGCMHGVDMPPLDNFLIRNKEGTKNRTLEEINSNYGGHLEVRYLSLEGMFSVFENLGLSRKSLCSYCIGGESC